MEFATSHSGFPKIEAIFLAQFHPDLGPIVRLSVPENAVELGEDKSYCNASGIKSDADRRKEGPAPSHSTPDQLGFSHAGQPQPQPQQQQVEVVELIKRPVQLKSAAKSDKINFNAVQTLVIPKLALFERLITINTGPYKLMCYPIAIEGNYARNMFIFNMCFAFDINADTKCYGPVVRRVGGLLKELEISSRLLSDPEGERPLRTMMRQLVNKLNDHAECKIELDLKGLSQSLASTGICIKLFPYYGSPKHIEPYHVPVKTVDFEVAKLMSAQAVYQEHMPGDVMWDLVLDSVIRHLDNVNHVRRIALLTKIREETVIQALRHLDYYGCIVLTDIFQFGNVYEVQSQIQDLYRNAWLQRECRSFVTRDGQAGSMKIDELIRLYSTIQRRRTVAEWIVDGDIDTERLDVRRFIVFGVIHQLLRRVHCFPVLCAPDRSQVAQEQNTAIADAGRDAGLNATDSNSSSSSSSDGNAVGPRLLDMLDGTHHFDEICVVEDKDAATLRGLFDTYGNIEYIYV